MSGSTYTYVANTGVIVPDTATLQTEVQGEWQGVFGADLNVTADTPQGVMITAEIAARNNVVQNNAAVANQINPNVSSGVFLDAVAALTGLERQANTFTVVNGIVLSGVQDSPIPIDSILTDANGNQFALSAAVTLDPVTGTATGTYVAALPGPLACATGTMTIQTSVLGLETANNPGTSVVLGTAQQADEPFRVLRRNTLFKQGVALVGATVSALYDLQGVIGVQYYENVTSSSVTIEGVTVVAKSIWACVDGGTPLAIATALLANKSNGCAWNGAQTLSVVEPSSGQSYPVKWDVPTLVATLVQVTVAQGTFSGNPTGAVVQAVLDFYNNVIEGVQGIQLAGNVSPFEIATGIMAECPGLYIKSVQISLASSVNYQPTELAMLINQKATVTSGDISIVLV